MIALVTDFGWQDPYVGQLKGAILGVNPAVRIVDVGHDLRAFDLPRAAYYLDKVARYYPAGVIFVVVVDPGVGGPRKGIALKTDAGKFFVGPDNGVFSRVVGREGLAAAHELNRAEYFRVPEVSDTFHGRDVFGPVAAHVARGVGLAKIGAPLTGLTMLKTETASRLGRRISGRVVYVDHYGNVITDILPEHFDQDAAGRLVRVTLNGRTGAMPLVRAYADGPDNRVFALFGSDGELELAMNQKSAAALLKARPGLEVEVVY